MTKLHAELTDLDDQPSNKSSLAASRRQRYTRARTGCLTCRNRRKKCDETRPRCNGCTRNGLSCSWPRLQRPETEGTQLVALGNSDRTNSTSSSPSSSAADEALTTTWNTSLGSFVLSNNRAASLYPSSQLLLRRYLSSTATICTHLPPHVNPFITDVLPLAATDDLVMNVVLAMGGVHLSSEGPSENLSEIYRDTSKHYTLALQALRDACLTEFPSWDAEKRVRVLLVLVLLAHVEAIRGDIAGSIYPHLRAGWHLVQELVRSSGPAKKTSYSSLEGFAMETYMYLALISNIIPDTLNTGRSVANDGFMTSLSWIQGYSNFGTFLSYGLDLYKIPIVCSLARDCLKLWRARSRAQGDKPDSRTPESWSALSSGVLSVGSHLHTQQKSLSLQVSKLLAWLNSWTSPEPTPNTAAFRKEHRMAGDVYRLTLLIYLKACCIEYDAERIIIASGTCGHYPRPSSRMMAEIDQHLEALAVMMPTLMFSPFGATMIWPTVVAGSCFTKQEHRSLVTNAMKTKDSPFFRNGEMDQVGNILLYLWNHPGQSAYGPFGLEMVMKEAGLNLSMA